MATNETSVLASATASLLPKSFDLPSHVRKKGANARRGQGGGSRGSGSGRLRRCHFNYEQNFNKLLEHFLIAANTNNKIKKIEKKKRKACTNLFFYDFVVCVGFIIQ